MTGAIIPKFHDGWLLGLILADPAAEWGAQNANVRLQRYDEAKFNLNLAGLMALQVDGLREINEIAELTVVTGETFASRGFDAGDVAELFEKLLPSPHPEAEERHHEEHSALLIEWIRKVESGAAALVTIEGTADLVALTAAVQLVPVPLKPLP